MTTFNWTALGTALRASTLDAHEELVSVEFAYEFLLDNPECFIGEPELLVMNAGLPELSNSGHVQGCYTMDQVRDGEVSWPEDMPAEPPMDLVNAYLGVTSA